MLRILWIAWPLNKLAGSTQGVGDGLQARRRRCYDAIDHPLDIRQGDAEEVTELMARVVRLVHRVLIREHRAPALRSGFVGTKPNLL
jgi:hypothetical protein